MSEVTTVLPAPVVVIVEHESTLKAAIQGIGTIVELRPDSLALVASGTQVQALIDRITADIEIADTLTIDSPEMLEEAQAIAGRLSTACADSGAIEDERKALTTPFNDLVKKINEGYKVPREFIGGVLKGVKDKILSYNNEQQRLADQREAESAAERQRAATEAAEREAAAQRDAADLLLKAQDAQQQGSEVTASALMQQASVKVDEARQQATAAVTALHTRAVSAPVAKAKGVRSKWCAEVTDKAALIKHVASLLEKDDASLLHLLDVSMPNLNKLAGMQEAAFKLPGAKAVFEQSLAVRKVAA